jgi:transcription initiation factor TFIID/TFIIF subunit
MEILCTAVEKGGEHSLLHDLNFQKETYDAKHVIVSGSDGAQITKVISYFVIFLIPIFYQTFKNPRPGLLKILAESGPVPGDAQDVENGTGAGASASAKRTVDSHKSKKKGNKIVGL